MKPSLTAGAKTIPADGKQIENSRTCTPDFSALMLERYRLGELSAREKKAIQEALSADNALLPRIKALEDSDRELRRLYPVDFFRFPFQEAAGKRYRIKYPRFSRKFRMGAAGIAAVLLVCVFFPVYHFMRVGNNDFNPELAGAANSRAQLSDRAKGTIPAAAGFSLYLKGESEIPLPNPAVLHEGSTVQIAYASPSGADYYGVIFSIDGRSELTMHFPYRKGQSSLLMPGTRILLNEAYILDDAPDYEVFAMLVSDKPLDTEAVIREAERIAGSSSGSMQVVEAIRRRAEDAHEAFEDCKVETFTVIKE